jgi:quinol-cytochrome oxidoreductase complex cytochrome b subunit
MARNVGKLGGIRNPNDLGHPPGRVGGDRRRNPGAGTVEFGGCGGGRPSLLMMDFFLYWAVWHSDFPAETLATFTRSFTVVVMKSRGFSTFTTAILHLHPASVREDSLKLHRTFGLGGAAALLFALQCVTGILLRFYYEPFPGKAYDSILVLRNDVLFGQFIRNIHHWSGVFLLVVTFLHLLRVFLTGAYRGSRKVSWLVGLALLALVVLSDFTGYLLPWDQLAYWAITVSTSILQYVPLAGDGLREFVIAGKEVNADTLLIFYNLHTAVFPFLIILLAAYHFWRVRKAGGVLVPEAPESQTLVPSIPNLVYREGVAALVVLALIMSISVVANAPLLGRADPNYSLNPTKAPWYFGGIQELLMHFHPLFAAFIIPLAAVAGVAFLPFVKYENPPSGLWFHSETGKKTASIAAIAGAVATIAGILTNEYLFKFEGVFPGMPPVVSNGLVPFFLLLASLYGFSRFLMRRFKASTIEVVQALFVLVVASLVILTLTSVMFRGTDMALTLPWR